jgi:iron complex outermembrane receptor protein
MPDISRSRPDKTTRWNSWRPCTALVGALLSSLAWGTPPAGTADAETLQEVVVTARRIEERLQDVSVSVQALSGEYLHETRATRLYELQFAIPGLVVNSVGMYGAGFSLRGIADQRVTGLSVAPHLNGVYLGSANLAIVRSFDLERIEVLKGPQGTLYGRNATGGTINFITRPPQDSFDSEVEVSYGTYGTFRAQGHANLPMEKAAVRLAFISSEGEGYIRNSIDDRRFADEDFWGLRAALRIDATNELRIDVMAQHVRDDGDSGDLWLPRPDFLVNPKDIRLTTVTYPNPYLVSEIDNLDVNLEYHLGFATLRSITGYARGEVRNVDDCAGMPVLQGCVRSALPNKSEQWSQELQLAFAGSGRVDGLVGAYYSEFDGTLAFYQFLPLVNPAPLEDSVSNSSESAAAVFGQATLRFAERWSTTAGVRLSEEKQRASSIGTGIQDSPTLVVSELESDDVSWRLDLSRAFNDDVLIYAAVSTGYKSGGFAGENDSYGPEHLVAYEVGGKSQWLERRLTVNAAAFFYDYEDLQVSTTEVRDGRVVVEVDNAAAAELYGIDAEIGFQVSERWFLSSGVVWLPKREFIEYQNEATGDILSGNELVRAPEWSATAAIGYEHPLQEFGRLSARLEYSFRSDYFFTPENDPTFAQGSFGLLNASLKFEAANDKWYVFASGRNLTDQDYFNHVFFQSSPGYPDTYEIGAGYRF